VRAVSVVVVHELTEDGHEVASTEDQNPV